jgi:hypothetical protein
MESITHYVEQRLKLKVNREKSVVDRATKRPLLGFRFAYRRDEARVLVDPKRVKRAKDRLRQLTSRRWGVSMERRIKEINRFTVGWTAYFAFADTPSPFRELDKWLRRRLRQVRWKEWKRVRTKLRKLRAAGIPEHDARRWAFSRKGYWRIAGSPVLASALPSAYWAKLGLQGFPEPYRRFRDAKRTAARALGVFAVMLSSAFRDPTDGSEDAHLRPCPFRRPSMAAGRPPHAGSLQPRKQGPGRPQACPRKLPAQDGNREGVNVMAGPGKESGVPPALPSEGRAEADSLATGPDSPPNDEESPLFLDGNKRTAWVALRTFLVVNGYDVAATQSERASWILELSRGAGPDDLAAHLRTALVPLPPRS